VEEGLRPVGTKPPYILQSSCIRKVPYDCLVSFETNRYSVPRQYVSREVDIQPGPNNEIRIFLNGSLIAQHQRVLGRYKVIANREHYRNILKKPEPQPPLRWDGGNPEVQIRNLDVYAAIGGELHG
jgi:hypothetical protein